VTEKDRLFYQAFGENLSRARRKNNLKQEAVAASVGLSRTSITNIESGRQPVQLHLALEFARLYNTRLTDLLPTPEGLRTLEVLLPQLDATKRSWVERVINSATLHNFGEKKNAGTVQLRKKESRRGTRKTED
jgi:transcriptional regulator with XRE-family HTH domain